MIRQIWLLYIINILEFYVIIKILIAHIIKTLKKL